MKKISKIILIGFMGSGKTTIAKKLSKLLQLPIYEMDEIILRSTKYSSIKEIFKKKGEIYFRLKEFTLAKKLAKIKSGIISTGGGVVENKIIIDLLKENHGKIFYLKTKFSSIINRLKNQSDRPLFENINQALKIFQRRKNLYKSYSHFQINTDTFTPDEITKKILEILKKQDEIN